MPAATRSKRGEEILAFVRDPKNHRPPQPSVYWEDLMAHFGTEEEEATEAALNDLMDAGEVDEPILGRLRSVK